MGEIQIGPQTIPCRLTDVSEGGLALVLMTRDAVHPHRPVSVRFRLGRGNSRRVELRAVVLRRQRDATRQQTVWHLRALDMDSEVQDRLRDYVHHHEQPARLSRERARRALRERLARRAERARTLRLPALPT